MSKTLYIVGAIILVIILYLWYSQSSSTKNESFIPIGDEDETQGVEYKNMIDNDRNNAGNEDTDGEYDYQDENTPIDYINPNGDEEPDTYEDSYYEQDPPYRQQVRDIINNGEEGKIADRIKRKFVTVDTARPGVYKMVDYVNGVRGSQTINEDLESYLENSNDLIQDDYMENDKYSGYDESDGQFASYKPERRKSDKYKLDEIFNSGNFLPKSKNNDWFEVLPEAISAKNRHLINVSKPIGINTIGTSLRNASWDIRGTPTCPKFVVAPWLQSTIEPDTNMKSLC
jgi:hypothetical protein